MKNGIIILTKTKVDRLYNNPDCFFVGSNKSHSESELNGAIRAYSRIYDADEKSIDVLNISDEELGMLELSKTIGIGFSNALENLIKSRGLKVKNLPYFEDYPF